MVETDPRLPREVATGEPNVSIQCDGAYEIVEVRRDFGSALARAPLIAVLNHGIDRRPVEVTIEREFENMVIGMFQTRARVVLRLELWKPPVKS